MRRKLKDSVGVIEPWKTKITQSQYNRVKSVAKSIFYTNKLLDLFIIWNNMYFLTFYTSSYNNKTYIHS